MLFNSVISVAVFAAGLHAAPTKFKRQAPPGVPDFVLKYAPVVYLHSQEKYFPTDIQSMLNNSVPQVAYKKVPGPEPLDLNNLDKLGGDVWLTSKEDVTKDPQWIKGIRPDDKGKTNNGVTATVIVNDKGDGNVDAFYMYFYAYNYGGEVAKWKKLNFGNHVGDWEHTMVRFKNGKPEHIWFSQHANGQAFEYNTVEKKDGVRPIAYSSRGSHANYAMGGTHDHLIPNLNLPGGVLEDYTEKSIYWDPLLAAYWFSYNAGNDSFKPYQEGTPTAWLKFKGRWGDQTFKEDDPRQVTLFGAHRYEGGPTGPADKQLNRKDICPQNGKKCILRKILVPKSVALDDEEEELENSIVARNEEAGQDAEQEFDNIVARDADDDDEDEEEDDSIVARGLDDEYDSVVARDADEEDEDEDDSVVARSLDEEYDKIVARDVDEDGEDDEDDENNTIVARDVDEEDEEDEDDGAVARGLDEEYGSPPSL